ncbi:hypothetical protein PYCC9005_006001 [Savitreella phatthalungensis]
MSIAVHTASGGSSSSLSSNWPGPCFSPSAMKRGGSTHGGATPRKQKSVSFGSLPSYRRRASRSAPPPGSSDHDSLNDTRHNHRAHHGKSAKSAITPMTATTSPLLAGFSLSATRACASWTTSAPTSPAWRGDESDGNDATFFRFSAAAYDSDDDVDNHYAFNTYTSRPTDDRPTTPRSTVLINGRADLSDEDDDRLTDSSTTTSPVIGLNPTVSGSVTASPQSSAKQATHATSSAASNAEEISCFTWAGGHWARCDAASYLASI